MSGTYVYLWHLSSLMRFCTVICYVYILDEHQSLSYKECASI